MKKVTRQENEQHEHDTAAESVRRERDRLLAASDYAVLPDAPVSDTEQWKGYRQSLRDLTEQDGFPFSVDWPGAPE